MLKTALSLPLLLSLIGALLAGCAYAPPIRQGNFISRDAVDKVHVGMTRQQVSFALGTPMLNDPLHQNRWDYVFYLNPNDGEPIERKHVVIYFQNQKVSRIARPGQDKQAADGKS